MAVADFASTSSRDVETSVAFAPIEKKKHSESMLFQIKFFLKSIFLTMNLITVFVQIEKLTYLLLHRNKIEV